MKSEGMAQFLSIATWDRAFSESTTDSRNSYYITGHLMNQIPLSNNGTVQSALCPMQDVRSSINYYCTYH